MDALMMYLLMVEVLTRRSWTMYQGILLSLWFLLYFGGWASSHIGWNSSSQMTWDFRYLGLGYLLWLFTILLGVKDHRQFTVLSDILDTSLIWSWHYFPYLPWWELGCRFTCLNRARTTITTRSMDHMTFLNGSGHLCRLIDIGCLV